MTTRSLLGSALVVAAIVGTTGCLTRDTSHRLYLSPDGSLEWAVLDQDVRSDKSDAGERLREEQEFLDSIAAGAPPAAEGLRRLGPESLHTRLLRKERPYTVLTEARFMRVDEAINRFLTELSVPGEVLLTQNAHGATLSVSIDVTTAGQTSGGETPVSALIEDLERYRVVLTHGRFDAATGFTIVEEGNVALFNKVETEALDAHGGVLTLSLAWTREP